MYKQCGFSKLKLACANGAKSKWTIQTAIQFNTRLCKKEGERKREKGRYNDKKNGFLVSRGSDTPVADEPFQALTD